MRSLRVTSYASVSSQDTLGSPCELFFPTASRIRGRVSGALTRRSRYVPERTPPTPYCRNNSRPPDMLIFAHQRECTRLHPIMESNRLLANLQLLDEDNACPASHLRVIGSGFGTLGLSNEILCDGQCFARWHWRGEERIGDDYPDKCYKKGKSPLVSTDWSDTAIVCCEVRKPSALTEGETPLSPWG